MRILLATPSSRDPKWGYVISLLGLRRNDGTDIGFYFSMSSSLNENRRDIVKYAQKHRYDRILWLDDDMIFPGETLTALVAHGVPIVGCNCTTRKPPVVTTAIKNNERIPSIGRSGLEDVDGVGFAVMLTDITVFSALPEPWFATPFDRDAKDERGYLTEDLYFCQLARRGGFKIMVDHDLSQKIAHIGEWEFHHGMVE